MTDLRTALEPFVALLERQEELWRTAGTEPLPDGEGVHPGFAITWGDLRRARAALSPAPALTQETSDDPR